MMICKESNLFQAEVLQNWAEALLAVSCHLPDAELSPDVERQASIIAQPLFKQAVESYQQVCCTEEIHHSSL